LSYVPLRILYLALILVLGVLQSIIPLSLGREEGKRPEAGASQGEERGREGRGGRAPSSGVGIERKNSKVYKLIYAYGASIN